MISNPILRVHSSFLLFHICNILLWQGGTQNIFTYLPNAPALSSLPLLPTLQSRGWPPNHVGPGLMCWDTSPSSPRGGRPQPRQTPGPAPAPCGCYPSRGRPLLSPPPYQAATTTTSLLGSASHPADETPCGGHPPARASTPWAGPRCHCGPLYTLTLHLAPLRNSHPPLLKAPALLSHI